ncbi:hypothetical protein OROMI_026449 [Orobanche minor]
MEIDGSKRFPLWSTDRKGSVPKYIGSFIIIDPDYLSVLMHPVIVIRIPSLSGICQYGDNSLWHYGISVASGNFLGVR